MEQLQAQLKSIFKNLPHEVPLILFTQPGKNDLFSAACRFLVRAVREVTPKVTLREYDLKHPMAKKMNVNRAPTLVFDPDRYKIRWLGAPIGEEARTFVEAVLMMGNRSSGLSQESLKVLKKIASPREVKVFVSPSCPYCPQQAVNALKAAVERPDLISLELIDIQANPDLADQYSAQSVPQTYANDVLIAQGAQAEELFRAFPRQDGTADGFHPRQRRPGSRGGPRDHRRGPGRSHRRHLRRAQRTAFRRHRKGSPGRSGRHNPCGGELPRLSPRSEERPWWTSWRPMRSNTQTSSRAKK